MLDKVFPSSIATKDASKNRSHLLTLKKKGFWRVGDPRVGDPSLCVAQYLFCQHLFPGVPI